ncbi:glycosyltransferase family 61 protein [Xylophilus sp. GOD-11R]|uniref:glycosyltransferase family 61 protein n=1 Tax=Xylophilus sp. GOD-11R TaxID=3089814 RepID=UPI00298BFC9A|nr:glycosyltransferase family 61 protein [Xylophilus sp. GOD-11R]WPB56550.1 glycosyltransferase family 61 protein [Xylophilus sp. GOD-11R]
MSASFNRRPSPFLLSPPLTKVISKVAGKRIANVSESHEVISAGHRFQHPPAIFDERELEGILGTAETSNIAEQLRIARGQWSDHGASIAYTLKDVFHCDGIFYGSRYRHNVTTHRGGWINYGRAPWVSGGVLAQCWLGAKYFGHSLHEEAPMALLGMQRGKLIGTERRLTAQQLAYLNLFGVASEMLPARAWIAKLEILVDDAYSLSKVGRWKQMRAMVRHAAGQADHPGVFLARGATGQNRQLVNEAAVADYFRSIGFKVINPGEAELPEIMAAVAGARIVVGVEGSQLAHGFFGVREAGAFLVIQPPGRFDNAYKERCDLSGIKYSFVVAKPAPGGFTIGLDQIERGLERLEKVIP